MQLAYNLSYQFCVPSCRAVVLLPFEDSQRKYLYVLSNYKYSLLADLCKMQRLLR